MAIVKGWSGSAWKDVKVWNGSAWIGYTAPSLNTAMGTYYFTSNNQGWTSSSVLEGATQVWTSSGGYISIVGTGGLYGSGAGHSIYSATPTEFYLPQGSQFKHRAYARLEKIANGVTGENVSMQIEMRYAFEESSTYEVVTNSFAVSDSGWGWAWLETPLVTVPAPTITGMYTKIRISTLSVRYDESWQLATPASQHRIWLDQAHVMNSSNAVVLAATTPGNYPLKVWNGTAWV